MLVVNLNSGHGREGRHGACVMTVLVWKLEAGSRRWPARDEKMSLRLIQTFPDVSRGGIPIASSRILPFPLALFDSSIALIMDNA